MSPRAPMRSFEADEVILGKYRVIRALGVGGYGCVLEAEHLRTTRLVAIKVVDGDALARNPAAARRLKLEARAAARLSHPNSVAVIDLEEDSDGTLFFVQEHLDGETLHARLERERRLPWREAFSVMAPVMSALAEAHRKSIVHRDVKPENIFLAKSAPGAIVPKVIDFGVARVFDAGEMRLTQQDRVVGTPWYMSPEQAAGERDLDGQTDVWAVGVVLYECVAGASPFSGNNVEALMRAIAEGDHTPLRLRCPELPERVAAVIERCLARDRSERHPSMHALLDATHELLGRRASEVGVLSAPLRSDPPPVATPRDVSNDHARRTTTTDEGAHSLTARPRANSPGIALAIFGMALTAVGGFALGARTGATANASTPMVIRTSLAAPAIATPAITPPAAAPPVIATPAITPPVAAPPITAPPIAPAAITRPAITHDARRHRLHRR